MSDSIKRLALIPARGGSKRLPGKNTRLLGDKPLVAHTIEAAIESACFDKIVLSTDDQKIVEIGNSYKEVSVDKRPTELGSDTATVREVALELMERYKEANDVYDVLTLMLPTCPFRNIRDIQEGHKLLSDEVDFVISVSLFEFPPQKGSMIDSNGFLHPLWPNSPLYSGKTRTQDQFPAYHENGTFFICRWKSLEKNKFYYIGKVKPYIIEEKYSVDIDEELHLMYANFLIEKGIV